MTLIAALRARAKGNVMLYLDWQIEPVLIGLITTLGVTYYLGWDCFGPAGARQAVPTGQALVFGAGLVLLFLIEGSPPRPRRTLPAVGPHGAAPAPHLRRGALAAGRFARLLLRAALINKTMYPISRVLLHPLTTFVAFAVVMYVYHLPASTI